MCAKPWKLPHFTCQMTDNLLMTCLPDSPLPGEALSPLDGRYHHQTEPLTTYLSEGALNRARLYVEVEWLIFSLDAGIYPGLEPLDEETKQYLRDLPQNFDAEVRSRLAQFEAETRHDVKAVEYLLREHLAAGPAPLPSLQELVHVFCTSEDINNLSYALCVQGAVRNIWLPAAQALTELCAEMAHDYADIAMLSRTHGQTATPTTLGKELAVFAYRLGRQVRQVEGAEFLGKFNGATGTFSAHLVALPEVDWIKVSRDFVTHLGLTWNPLTTQIESHDWMAELFSAVAHFNRVAHNLATDCWTYISLGYFHQQLGAQGSTGSSTMPHKINPIRFENGEANLEISTSLLDTLSATLVTSRLQRDLTDSTTQRNIGSAFGYSLLALDNIIAGLKGLEPDCQVIAADLGDRWEVLAEAIQQVLRVQAATGQATVDSPYEKLKELTRGHGFSQDALQSFVESLDLAPEPRQALMDLRPESYSGLAEELVSFLD